MKLISTFRNIEKLFLENNIDGEIMLSRISFEKLRNELSMIRCYEVNLPHTPTYQINFMSLVIKEKK